MAAVVVMLVMATVIAAIVACKIRFISLLPFPVPAALCLAVLLLSSTLRRKEWLIGRSAVLCFVIRAGEWEGSNRRLCA